MITVGYAATRAEGLQMLAEYNNNPFDTKAAKMTFSDVYEEWSRRKYPTVSESNVKGYTASYKACGTLYNKVFKDIRLVDRRLPAYLPCNHDRCPDGTEQTADDRRCFHHRMGRRRRTASDRNFRLQHAVPENQRNRNRTGYDRIFSLQLHHPDRSI